MSSRYTRRPMCALGEGGTITERTNVSRWVFLSSLFIVAFALRFGLVLVLRDIHQPPQGASSADDVHFHALSVSLAEGNGYQLEGKPTAFRAPGFPFLLAGVYRITGVCALAGYLFLCLVGALTCVVAYFLALDLALSERGAKWVSVLTACYLPHMYFSTVFLSEASFVLSLALGVWLTVRWYRERVTWLLILAGFVLGYSALIRGYTLLLVPLFGLAFLFDSQAVWLIRFRNGLVFGLCFLAVIAPWTWRNSRVLGHPVLTATNGGSTFYGGNNDRVVTERRQYGHWLSTTELPHRDLIDATPDEVSHDRMEWKLGIEWVKNHPEKWPQLVAFKLGRFVVGPPEFDAGGWGVRALRFASYWPLLALMLLGMLECVRRREFRTGAWVYVHLAFFATIVTAIIFWGSPRFRDANAPLLMLYAVVGLNRLFSNWVSPRSKAA